MVPTLDEIILDIQNKEMESTRLKLNALTKLTIYRRAIEDETLKELCDLLKNNASIIALDLYYSELDDSGFTMISELLNFNSSITEINIGYNKAVSSEGLIRIIKACSQSKFINKVDISFNNFTPALFNEIANYIESNKVIISLDLNNDLSFTQTEIQKIINAYKSNGTLLKIVVPDDQPEKNTIQKLSENFMYNANQFVESFKTFIPHIDQNIVINNNIQFSQITECGIKELGLRGLIHFFQKRGEIILAQLKDDSGINDTQRSIKDFKYFISNNFLLLNGICKYEGSSSGEEFNLVDFITEIKFKIFEDIPLVEYTIADEIIS